MPGLSPPNMAYAHQYEEGLRHIGSLPRSLVRFLAGPVAPFDVQFPGHDSEPTCVFEIVKFLSRGQFSSRSPRGSWRPLLGPSYYA